MPAADTPRSDSSAKALTYSAYASFLPIGIATVLLGPMLPTLSARWALNYSQAGALFTVQYLASTLAVALSGVLVARWGFRFAIKTGLFVMALGVALLMIGPKLIGMICIAAYGAGLGLAVPAANLVVAEVNPRRRSAALSVLNFCWSLGAVACPFLVAAAAKIHRVPLLLAAVAGFALLVTVAIAAMPASIVEPAGRSDAGAKNAPTIDWKHRALPELAALFFVYVGTENAFGGWVASYAKSLGTLTATMSLMTPSFFYGALTVGRWVAPLAAASDRRIAAGTGGNIGRVFRNGGAGRVAFPGRSGGECVRRGIGPFQRVSDYDFAVVARVWTRRVTGGVGYVYDGESGRGVHAVAGGRFVESIGHTEGGAGRAAYRRRGDVCAVLAKVDASDNGTGCVARRAPVLSSQQLLNFASTRTSTP